MPQLPTSLLDADIKALGLEESYQIDPEMENVASLLETLAADLRAGRVWTEGNHVVSLKREIKQAKGDKVVVELATHFYFKTTPDYVIRSRGVSAPVVPNAPTLGPKLGLIRPT